MAKHYDVNNISTAAVGARVMFDFFILALANGWTCTLSCDGTTAGAGNRIDSVAEMLSAWAWFVLQGPNGREYLFSGSGYGGDTTKYWWYVAYSPAAGFTGGDTTHNPTATDQETILGTAGVAGADTAVQLFSASGFYCHLMADDAEDSFYISCNTTGTAVCATFVHSDELAAGVTGDTDQCVLSACYGGSELLNVTAYYADTDNEFGSKAILDTTGTPALQRVAILCVVESGGHKVFPHNGITGAGVNNDDGKDPIMPAVYARCSNSSPPYGYKGVSSFIKLVGTGRAAGDSLSVDASKDHVVFGSYRTAFPWPTGITPLI